MPLFPKRVGPSRHRVYDDRSGFLRAGNLPGRDPAQIPRECDGHGHCPRGGGIGWRHAWHSRSLYEEGSAVCGRSALYILLAGEWKQHAGERRTNPDSPPRLPPRPNNESAPRAMSVVYAASRKAANRAATIASPIQYPCGKTARRSAPKICSHCASVAGTASRRLNTTLRGWRTHHCCRQKAGAAVIMASASAGPSGSSSHVSRARERTSRPKSPMTLRIGSVEAMCVNATKARSNHRSGR
jgi:hypothetical protein